MTLSPKRLETACCRPLDGPRPQLTLASEPQSVRAARAWAREFVAYHLPKTVEEHAENIQLVVSELVTNAVRYGSEPGDSVLVVMALAESGERIRIEVRDPVRRRPRHRAGAGTGERVRGRGLFIVEALAERWGVDDRPLGKTVWAEMAR